jgi:hypothetical protein
MRLQRRLPGPSTYSFLLSPEECTEAARIVAAVRAPRPRAKHVPALLYHLDGRVVLVIPEAIRDSVFDALLTALRASTLRTLIPHLWVVPRPPR